jgi:hypothetical protein
VKQLSLAEARRIAVRSQRLDRVRRPTPAALLDTVKDIGYLQLDPTNVVARNHLLVLWSRLGWYDRADLDRLMWKDRSLYETVSLILPTEDRPLHEVHVRASRRGTAPYSARRNAWVKKNDRLRRSVLSRLRREGPLPITAFEDRASHGWRSSGWTADRNVSQMLSFLMRLGHIAVGGRAGGKRVWILARDWLPPVRPLGARVAERKATERALRALGIATLRELRYSYAFGGFVTSEALASLERDGLVTRVSIEGFREPHFVLSALRGADESTRTTLLSPFDNLIIQRDRTEKLFGMRYRMEIYVPKHLRVRGFWAMPILHGGRLIGTVDPKVDRQRGTLDVLTFHLEREAPRDRATRRAIEDAVDDLAAFTGAREVTWPRGIASSYSRP